MMNSGRGLFWGHDMGGSGRFVSMTKHGCILTTYTLRGKVLGHVESHTIQISNHDNIFIIAHRLVDTRVDKRCGSRARAVGANLTGSIFVILHHQHQAQ